MSDQERSSEFAQEVERRAYQERLDAFLSSHDAAHALTEDALNGRISLPRVIHAAADVARFADEAIAIVKDEYKPSLDCKEGCCYCCCKPGVLTSIPEFLRILEHVHATFDATEASGVRDRAAQYTAQLAGRSFDEPTNESVPCPLLRDDRCSVYEVRPLTCRGYNSTSVDACRAAHEDAKVLVPIFAVIKDVTDGATVGAAAPLRDAGFNDALVDLGTALNIAMAGDREYSHAIVNGDASLVPAENQWWVGELWNRVHETARQIGVQIESTTGNVRR